MGLRYAHASRWASGIFFAAYTVPVIAAALVVAFEAWLSAALLLLASVFLMAMGHVFERDVADREFLVRAASFRGGAA